jgi:hypothetical protein
MHKVQEYYNTCTCKSNICSNSGYIHEKGKTRLNSIATKIDDFLNFNPPLMLMYCFLISPCLWSNLKFWCCFTLIVLISLLTQMWNQKSYKILHLIMKEVQPRGWTIHLYYVTHILLYHVTQEYIFNFYPYRREGKQKSINQNHYIRYMYFYILQCKWIWWICWNYGL